MKPSDLNTGIISILSQDHPLNLKQIHRKLPNRITYQGVFKALTELVRKGIIIKEERLYSLKKEWLKSQLSQYHCAYSNYFDSKFSENEKIQMLKFQSIIKLVEFLDDYLTKFSKPYKVYLSVRKILPFIPESFINLIDKINKNGEIFLACKNNSIIEKIAAIFYKSLGVKVKTGAQISHYNSIFIEDEVIQYFFFPTTTYRRMLYSFSKRIKSKSTLNILRKNSQLVNKKMDIFLIINKHPVLIDDIKKSVKKKF